MSADRASAIGTTPKDTALRSLRTPESRGVHLTILRSWHAKMGQPRSCCFITPRTTTRAPGEDSRALSFRLDGARKPSFAERTHCSPPGSDAVPSSLCSVKKATWRPRMRRPVTHASTAVVDWQADDTPTSVRRKVMALIAQIVDPSSIHRTHPPSHKHTHSVKISRTQRA